MIRRSVETIVVKTKKDSEIPKLGACRYCGVGNRISCIDILWVGVLQRVVQSQAMSLRVHRIAISWRGVWQPVIVVVLSIRRARRGEIGLIAFQHRGI